MIRKLRPEDMEEASRVNLSNFPEAANSITEEFCVEMDMSYVAIVDDRIVGISVVITTQLDSEYIPGIAIFCILKEYRRRGIGRDLLKATIEGAKKIWLMVRESNQPAIQLYEAVGFERKYRCENYYRWPQEDGIAMVKLNPRS